MSIEPRPEDIFGRKVDVVSAADLRPRLNDTIIADAVLAAGDSREAPG
jgi:predicted nucleotidyltransferase